MKIYIYRTINNCINGTSDLCQISSHKYKRTKSGDIARNQAPFDKQLYKDYLIILKKNIEN